MNPPPQVFDPKRHAAKLARARRIAKPDADFLSRRVSIELADRISATNRKFESVFEIFSTGPALSDALAGCENVGSVEPVQSHRANLAGSDTGQLQGMDTMEKNSADLICCLFELHWQNDLPGALAQIRNFLKPDGLFLAVAPAEGTLHQLNTSLISAETRLTGGAAMRVDPFLEVRQAGDLLQRAGFALPVVDREEITVRYNNIRALIEDLRAMGATSALSANMPMLKKLMKLTGETYHARFGHDDRRIPATFNFVFMSGWAPHESQQKPSKRGSATVSFSDVL